MLHLQHEIADGWSETNSVSECAVADNEVQATTATSEKQFQDNENPDGRSSGERGETMSNDHNEIRPEDYEEPRCLLCGEPYGAEQVESIPQQRVIDKLDEYMSRRDYAGAERHLLYWLAEAEANRDERGQLMLNNELMGFYRKQANRCSTWQLVF